MKIKPIPQNPIEETLVRLKCVACAKTIGEVFEGIVGIVRLKCERCKAFSDITLPENTGKVLIKGKDIFTYKQSTRFKIGK